MAAQQAAELASFLRNNDYEVEESECKLTVNDCIIEFFPGPKYGISGYVGKYGGADVLESREDVLEWLSGRPLRVTADKFTELFVEAIEARLPGRPIV